MSRKFSILAISAMIAGSLVASSPAQAADCTVSGPTTYTSGSNTYSVVAIKSGTACTWTAPTGITSLSILAVGGGGGGSARHGGGGNAGKFVESTSAAVSSGATLTISVGAGGAGGRGTIGGDPGLAGSSTTISGSGLTTVTATGGSGGAWAGGGTSGNGFTAGVGTGQWSCSGITSGWCGGGGAGSTANGESSDNGGNNRAGNGGAGSTASIYTSAVASTLSIPTAFAGGGGGGADVSGTAGTASFGGGAGSAGVVDATSASVNTGAGGGGSGYNNTGGQGNGGAGASGIVVIRWALAYGSVKLDGSSQYLSVPSSSDWNIGTGDFTVEWFQYQTSSTSFPRIFSFGSYPSSDLSVSIEGGTVYVWVEGSWRISYSLGATSNYFHKWVHFAVTRTSGTLALYYEGAKVASVANSSDIQTGTNPLKIGIEGAANTAFPGYLSNFHFVNGTSLYSGATLTRPTSPITAVANTKLLLTFGTSADLLTDTSGTSKVVSNNGSAVWDANNPFSTTVPNAPTLNSATGTTGGANLNVSIPNYNGGAPITSYEYQLDGGSWVNTGGSSLPITIAGLNGAQTYSVKVRAVNSVGAGAESGSRSFTTPATSYTITYDYQSATGGDSTPSDTYTLGGSVLVLPTPTRTSYVLDGWYSASTGGTKLGNGGANFTPSSTATIYARWVQRSLWNMGAATKIGTITTVSGIGNSYSASGSGTSVSLSYQADALPASTVIDVYLLTDTTRASQLITDTSSFVVNLVVAWKAADGTVPTTASGKPLSMTISDPAIKRGQKIYALLGDTVTDLGIASADGAATFEITDDPEIVIANTKPDSPTSVTGFAGSSKVTVSWTAPASTGGATITSYTVTASNGATCTTTTTSCEILGLTNGTAYTFTVTATNSVGTSTSSASSAAVNPVASSGGTSGGTVTPPTAPYVPSLPTKPTLGQGAIALIDGQPADLVVRRDEANISIIAQTSNTEFEVKLVAPTGATIAPQNLVLQGTQGDKLQFNGGGLAPLSEIKVYLFSTPTYLGTVHTNASGDFVGEFRIPASLMKGQHTLQFGGYLASGKIVSTSFALLVSSKTANKNCSAYFAAGSVDLTSVAKAAIRSTFASVATKKSLSILVVGFAQKTAFSGRDQYVAEARAANVAKYLKTLTKKVKVTTQSVAPATQTSVKARRAEIQFSWFG